MSNKTEKVAATSMVEATTVAEKINVASIDTKNLFLGNFKVTDATLEQAIATHCKATVLAKFGIKLKIAGESVTKLKTVNLNDDGEPIEHIVSIKLRKPSAKETLLEYWNSERLHIVVEYRKTLGALTQIPLAGFNTITQRIDIESDAAE